MKNGVILFSQCEKMQIRLLTFGVKIKYGAKGDTATDNDV